MSCLRGFYLAPPIFTQFFMLNPNLDLILVSDNFFDLIPSDFGMMSNCMYFQSRIHNFDHNFSSA